jgi:hypothetical protein
MVEDYIPGMNCIWFFRQSGHQSNPSCLRESVKPEADHFQVGFFFQQCSQIGSIPRNEIE